MSPALKLLAIALITLAPGLALSMPGPGIEFSTEESIAGSLALQKMISGNDTNTVDSDDSLGGLLVADHNRSYILQVSDSPAPAYPYLLAAPRIFLGNATPRAPPRT